MTMNPVSYTHLWDEDMKAAFNTEAAVTSINEMKKLVDEGCVTFLAPGGAISGVQTGVAAMTLAPETSYTCLLYTSRCV